MFFYIKRRGQIYVLKYLILGFEIFRNLNQSQFYHLYNKNIPKNGRKMGHFTVINDSLNMANKIADDIFLKLKNGKLIYCLLKL